MQKLSVVVLTHNDELRIVDCLESVIGLADELIIIDDESNDRTVELAARFTDKIHIRKLQNNFSNQRNFALNHTRNDWVLFVDSDEIVSDKLRNEIIENLKNPSSNGYLLKRIDVMWGRKIMYGEAGNVRLLRLARKGYGRWHGKVHEEWKVKRPVEELSSPLIHVPHPSVFEFVKEVDEYSELRAEDQYEKGRKSNFIVIIFYPLGKFFINYFMKKGYKDGMPGLIYAMIMSFHSFLVRGKLYLKQNG